MDINKLKILLVEDNLADADWIGEILTAETWQKLDLKHVKRVKEAIDSLSEDDFDAILLDLSLPDSQGIKSLDLVKQQAPQLPIVVLTALNDRDIAIKSVRQGAQDYLVKGRFEGESLSRAIYYAIERQRTEVNLLSSLHSILSESTSVRVIEDALFAPQEDIYVLEGNSIRSFLILPIWRSQSVTYIHEDLSLPLVKQTITHNKDEGLWGMLIAYNFKQTRKWHDWEINFLQRLTTQVTIAIQQSEVCCQLQIVNKKLQQLAILDGLTGVANRRYFDLVLDNEWQRLAREKQPLSLILCDIDYFKAYNDAYGHPQGDRCLQKVAKVLQKSIRRPADMVARYGGEEFAVILPNTDFNGASFVANKIQQLLAQKQLPHCQSAVSNYITCSLGITTQIPQSTQQARIAVELADRALYRAKKHGRNQIIGDLAQGEARARSHLN